jgi:hypothetical protein
VTKSGRNRVNAGVSKITLFFVKTNRKLLFWRAKTDRRTLRITKTSVNWVVYKKAFLS